MGEGKAGLEAEPAADLQRAERVRRISEAVDARRDDLVAFLQELVRTPSVTGEEGACQAVVAAQMRGLGLETEVWRSPSPPTPSTSAPSPTSPAARTWSAPCAAPATPTTAAPGAP